MKKLIMQLNDGAPGRDGVTAKSLKCITDHIAMPLSRLANLSFTQGVSSLQGQISHDFQ